MCGGSRTLRRPLKTRPRASGEGNNASLFAKIGSRNFFTNPKAEGKPVGEGARNTVGPSRKREGKPAGQREGHTVGMQPSAKAEGKPVGEGARNTVGPLRKREGKPAGERAGDTVGMQPSAKAEGKPVGEGARNTVGPLRKREGKPAGQRAGGTVGMQPSAKGFVKKSPGPILAKSEALLPSPEALGRVLSARLRVRLPPYRNRCAW
jgi:hypothetical protein